MWTVRTVWARACWQVRKCKSSFTHKLPEILPHFQPQQSVRCAAHNPQKSRTLALRVAQAPRSRARTWKRHLSRESHASPDKHKKNLSRLPKAWAKKIRQRWYHFEQTMRHIRLRVHYFQRSEKGTPFLDVFCKLSESIILGFSFKGNFHYECSLWYLALTCEWTAGKLHEKSGECFGFREKQPKISAQQDFGRRERWAN